MSAESICNGSSPLVRGARHEALAFFGAVRLIPARAGSTQPTPKRCEMSAAHPRSRGEHLNFTSWFFWVHGSSPLVRETLSLCRPFLAQIRLIPAHAGNTYPRGVYAVPCWAHPRSRGEHVSPRRVRCTLLGSSPLARGTYVGGNRHNDGVRLIPACAGNIP